MAYAIPWQNAAEFQFEIALDNVVFVLHAQWNRVANSWALDIFTRANVPVCLGIRLVRGTGLLTGPRTIRPTGQLVLQGAAPTYENMIDGSCRLIYVTAAEINGTV